LKKGPSVHPTQAETRKTEESMRRRWKEGGEAPETAQTKERTMGPEEESLTLPEEREKEKAIR